MKAKVADDELSYQGGLAAPRSTTTVAHRAGAVLS